MRAGVALQRTLEVVVRNDWIGGVVLGALVVGCGGDEEPEEIPDRFVTMRLEEPEAGGQKARMEKAKPRSDRAKGQRVEAQGGESLGGQAVGGLIGVKGGASCGSSSLGSGLAARGSGLGGGGSYGVSGGVGGLGSMGAKAISQDVVDHGSNPVEQPADDFLSTFAIDVDTGAYTQARRVLRSGGLPEPAAVRTEEFVNYLDYGYPEPEPERPFAVTLDAAPHPFQAGHHVLRVGLQGSTPTPDTRRPMHLTFLVDTSCSMTSSDRLSLAQESLRHLVKGLKQQDSVAIGTYAGGVAQVLEPTSAVRQSTILAAIDGLRTGGGTAMESGVTLAYAMADDAYVAGHENRVVVLSDGDANIGGSTTTDMLDVVRRYAGRGITLSTVGFGTGNYRDALMEQLANKGDGTYVYIDGPSEAERVFGDGALAALTTIARDVKIQVAFDPEDVVSYRLIGYENRAIADEDFRRDEVDAGEIGAGHTVTALYDVVLRPQRSADVATVHLRWKPPGPEAPATEMSSAIPDREFGQGSADLRLAFAMASFAEKLRRHESYDAVGWAAIRSIAAGAQRGDDRGEELLELIDAAAKLDEADRSHDLLGNRISVEGGLTRDAVQETVGRMRTALQYCYSRELARWPSLAGRLEVRATVASDGAVSNAFVAHSTMPSDEVERCVTSRFLRARFPEPGSAGVATIRVPIEFSPGT